MIYTKFFVYYTELIQQVKNNGDKITELLNQSLQLEPDTLNRAMIYATRNDDHQTIAELITKGATNVDDCLKISTKEKKVHARAMLLLVKAAQTGDKSIVQALFAGITVAHEKSKDLDDVVTSTRKIILSGGVSTYFAFKIAQCNEQEAVKDELLLRTNTCRSEGYINWNNFQLLYLDASLLRRIYWVNNYFGISQNSLQSLPPEIGIYLTQVCVFSSVVCFCSLYKSVITM